MSRPICDYADTDYQKEFWQNKDDRSYEDNIERKLLAQLLPQKGGRMLDIGAGFGRLTPEYRARFEQVVLLDYAQNLLDSARQTYGQDRGVSIIRADCYQMPLADHSIDWAISFRLMHHIADPDAFLAEVYRVLRPGATFILEFANKRHLAEIGKFLVGRSPKRPFSRQTYQYPQKVYFNFHPLVIPQMAQKIGFKTLKTFSISNLRAPFLKRIFSAQRLETLDQALRPFFTFMRLGPSLILVLRKPDGG